MCIQMDKSEFTISQLRIANGNLVDYVEELEEKNRRLSKIREEAEEMMGSILEQNEVLRKELREETRLKTKLYEDSQNVIFRLKEELHDERKTKGELLQNIEKLLQRKQQLKDEINFMKFPPRP